MSANVMKIPPRFKTDVMEASVRILAESSVRMLIEATELLRCAGDLQKAKIVLDAAEKIHEQFRKSK